MNQEAIDRLIEEFNEGNDQFAIGMNFLAKGICGLQAFIRAFDGGDLEATEGAALLEEAGERLRFAAEEIRRQGPMDQSLESFISGYLGLIAELRGQVGG